MELTWVSIIIIGLLLINLFVRFASNIKFSRIAAKFYRAMRSSKVVDGRVTLTAGTGFPMKGFECRSVMDETMFVREVHEHIVLLFENYCRNGRMPAMVVRGPAGNGKSWASMYLLRHCILNRVTVVYDNVLQGTEWIFWKSGYCEETRRGDSNYKRSAALSDSNAVHIFDAAAGKQVFCPLSRARLAVFTSTGCEYSKQLDRMDILRIVFPTANLRDCLAMGSVMGIETEEICDRFNRYSGNLRLIFEYSNKNGAEAYIDRAVRGASMDALQKIAFGTAYGSHDPAGVSSALLIALLTDIDALNGGPPWTPERMQAIQEAYSRSVKWGIASKYILAKIAEATQSSAEDFVRNFATAAKGISLLSNTRGRVLELFAAADFAAGKTYTMRRLLPDGLGPEIQEYWPARELVEAGEITLSQLILQYGNNSEVIVNMCKNFKGIDLLRPPNDLLQLTVNAEHTVQVDVVAAIRKSNKNSTNSSSNNNRARRSAKKPTRFIFAVPEDCYHNFKKARSYVHRDDKGQQHQCAFEFLPAALKTQLEGVEQWVLCL